MGFFGECFMNQRISVTLKEIPIFSFEVDVINILLFLYEFLDYKFCESRPVLALKPLCSFVVAEIAIGAQLQDTRSCHP